MLLVRQGKEDAIVAGPAVVETKTKEFDGKTFYEIGVGMGKDAEGNNLPIINVVVWGRKADINKGDRVFAAGKLKITKKDDKTYYSLTADFVAKENSVRTEDKPKEELQPIDDDTLPF